MTTKPHTSGGTCVGGLCGPRDYRGRGIGSEEHACPCTAGYRTFLDRNGDRLARNHRTARSARRLDRLPTGSRASLRSSGRIAYP
ncbi:hypothetical protein AB0903_32655 [Streptomyces sp. NPDC048389]|uniref:hypothetical protein n=1 Tax=Streptomyces sp. NPDC048389 TaxID=3154622 RepID=UPI003456AC1C